VRINDTRADYLLDTGAWMSVMTEGEAKRTGLEIRASGGVLAESSGKGVSVRTAIAKDVVLGSRRFQNVSFAILPEVEPWRSMPVGRGGILGIPILLALDCVRWTRGGAWELGCGNAATTAQSPNMVFFENHLLLSVGMQGTRQFAAFDTGAETTDLNANYARQFAADIKRNGVKDTTSVAGAGGTADIASVTLPAVAVQIGGTPVTLRPAHVTMQDNDAMGGRCCVGNVGLDLLLQTGTLTMDFAKMTLQLR
jgi:predicted aspartyl protease